VRDRSSDLQRTVETAAGERERLDGLGEQSLRGGRQPRLAPRERPGQLTVAGDADGGVPRALSFTRDLHALSYRRGGLAGRLAEQLAFRQARNVEPKIDPIEQGTREFLAVELLTVRRTGTVTP